jgi:hypothetical protein
MHGSLPPLLHTFWWLGAKLSTGTILILTYSRINRLLVTLADYVFNHVLFPFEGKFNHVLFPFEGKFILLRQKVYVLILKFYLFLLFDICHLETCHRHPPPASCCVPIPDRYLKINRIFNSKVIKIWQTIHSHEIIGFEVAVQTVFFLGNYSNSQDAYCLLSLKIPTLKSTTAATKVHLSLCLNKYQAMKTYPVLN